MKNAIILLTTIATMFLIGCKKESSVEVFPPKHVIISCMVNDFGYAHEGVDVPSGAEIWGQIRRTHIQKLVDKKEEINFTFRYLHLGDGEIKTSMHSKVSLISTGEGQYEVVVHPGPFTSPTREGKFSSYEEAYQLMQERCVSVMGPSY